MKNVLVAEWYHETNTFCRIPTTLASFTEHSSVPFLETFEKIKEFRGAHTKTVHGATFQSAQKFSWNLVTTISAEANPSGRLTDEAFEALCGKILAKIDPEVPLHGVLLHLHGAMVSESFEDCEGELLRRIRSALAPSAVAVPIVVTLDLHGNISDLMCEHANILLAVRTYPHVDFYECALRACELLQTAMDGIARPHTVLSRGRAGRQQLRGLDGGKTTEPLGPMNQLLQRARQLEMGQGDSLPGQGLGSGSVMVVSICAGFTAADIFDAGPSVTVTVDLLQFGDDSSVALTRATAAARRIGDELMDFVWATRGHQSARHLTIPQAVAFAQSHQRHRHSREQEQDEEEPLLPPVVVAEVTDNPGSGHYGDATNLLRALLESSPGLRGVLFYAIFDPAAALAAAALGAGGRGDISVGGNTDPSVGGGPLLLRNARVAALTDGRFQTFGPMGGGGAWQDFGLSVLLRVRTGEIEGEIEGEGDAEVVLISRNQQLLDLAQLTSLGADPYRKKLIVCKSNHHFRACLSAVVGSADCERIATADGGGLGSTLLALTAPYRRLRRPIWPLDHIPDTDTDTDTNLVAAAPAEGAGR